MGGPNGYTVGPVKVKEGRIGERREGESRWKERKGGPVLAGGHNKVERDDPRAGSPTLTMLRLRYTSRDGGSLH